MSYRTLSLLVGLLLTSTSIGHHSTANFDRSVAISITGTVTDFQFTNPHSLIVMDTDTAGQSATYSVFATSKVVLLRYGWRPDSIQAGDSISVTGHPDRDNPSFLYMTGITFADGTGWSRSEILE